MTDHPTPGDAAYLAAQRADLLRFARGSRCERGFGYLDASGDIDPGRPVELWITCRMTHVFALGMLAGEPPAPGGPDARELRALADHGVRSLRTSLADHEHGGWYAAVGDDSKQAYGHAFVVLAASSAVVAGIDGAAGLLDDALACLDQRFWDDAHGLVVDQWDRAWSRLDPYRGVNVLLSLSVPAAAHHCLCVSQAPSSHASAILHLTPPAVCRMSVFL